MARTERAEQEVTYQVKVLDRALDILDAFTIRRPELSIREIVQATGLNRTTTIRLVANLERRGVLQRSPTTGRYRLGHRLFEMGSMVYSSLSFMQAAAGPLSALEQRVGATIVLAVRDGDYIVTVDKRQGVGDGFAMVTMPDDLGTVHPLTYGLLGQVFLAALTPEEVEDLLNRYPLERHTPYSVLDRRHFLGLLPRVKNAGYATEVNEVIEGLMGIAAPVFDVSGNVVGVLSLGFPATREADVTFVDEAIRNVKQTAAEISANLGHPAANSRDDAGPAGSTES